jgi:hypothetical protein
LNDYFGYRSLLYLMDSHAHTIEATPCYVQSSY